MYIPLKTVYSKEPNLPMICSSCGNEAPNRYVKFHRNVHFFLGGIEEVFQGHYCKPCVHRTFRRTTIVSLFLGWWGILEIFTNPYYLARDIYTYARALLMPAAPPDARKPILDKPALEKLARCESDLERLFSREIGLEEMYDELAQISGTSPGQSALFVHEVLEHNGFEFVAARVQVLEQEKAKPEVFEPPITSPAHFETNSGADKSHTSNQRSLPPKKPSRVLAILATFSFAPGLLAALLLIGYTLYDNVYPYKRLALTELLSRQNEKLEVDQVLYIEQLKISDGVLLNARGEQIVIYDQYNSSTTLYSMHPLGADQSQGKGFAILSEFSSSDDEGSVGDFDSKRFTYLGQASQALSPFQISEMQSRFGKVDTDYYPVFKSNAVLDWELGAFLSVMLLLPFLPFGLIFLFAHWLLKRTYRKNLKRWEAYHGPGTQPIQ